jgi:hypothetical protein
MRECGICHNKEITTGSERNVRYSNDIPAWCKVYPWESMRERDCVCRNCGFAWIDMYQTEDAIQEILAL